MIAVDISWGSLAFTYKDGQWDPETCTYIGGGWEADPEGGASVSVTNNGTAAVQVEYQFTAAEQTVVKIFRELLWMEIISRFRYCRYRQAERPKSRASSGKRQTDRKL